ncbi:3-deoxy-D-manno-octulosonic acid kinase [Lacimicrobium alkaliphilum]|uniref:3-deoxy-D-manno-octulosonic acid kinase n=1 Tax=Lacimicrobium alkaliphilum TaxID=1526571 RepID=A0ABQ1RPT0_9ALTE|nr:3-deoxy-D-manno-octulosonic acid kinase [Lacimicrobium alkaliphilum]GGD77337.1 3-deoxy-D-manno-octulosonic acid kinase [Lacimicrobium alkaliphilum]
MEYKQQFAGNGHCFLHRKGLPVSMQPQIFIPEYWRSRSALTSSAKGRGTTVFIRPNADEDWALRHYRRGGLIGKLLDDRFVYTGLRKTRAWREFHLLAYLRQQHLPVPEPVAAHVTRSGCSYRADLITRLIPDSQDLHEVLSQRPLTIDEWESVGEVIARLHNCQVYHHDLNIRNLMLDAQGSVWIIDFDKCRRRSGNSWKQGNLNRLHRSLRKSASNETQWYWQESDFTTLAQRYKSAIAQTAP